MIAIDDMFRQPVAQALGWALLQFVWQGALVALLTAAVLAVLRRSAADVRYVVSTVALALMLTMPVVTTIQMLTSIDSRVTVGQGHRADAQPTGSLAGAGSKDPALRHGIYCRRGAGSRSRPGHSRPTDYFVAFICFAVMVSPLRVPVSSTC